jgi:hypothetical protein
MREKGKQKPVDLFQATDHSLLPIDSHLLSPEEYQTYPGINHTYHK